MSGGPGKTCQAHHDHHCSNNRPLALAAHSRTLNDFGSLEYPYRADRTEHNPDYRSHPHGWLHSRHKDRNDFVASPADGSSWRVIHLLTLRSVGPSIWIADGLRINDGQGRE